MFWKWCCCLTWNYYSTCVCVPYLPSTSGLNIFFIAPSVFSLLITPDYSESAMFWKGLCCSCKMELLFNICCVPSLPSISGLFIFFIAPSVFSRLITSDYPKSAMFWKGRCSCRMELVFNIVVCTLSTQHLWIIHFIYCPFDILLPLFTLEHPQSAMFWKWRCCSCKMELLFNILCVPSLPSTSGLLIFVIAPSVFCRLITPDYLHTAMLWKVQ